MPKILSFLSILLFLNTLVLAQTPSDQPCDAPAITVSDSAGMSIKHDVFLCCNAYNNFLKKGASCVSPLTDRDAWFKIGKMTAGQQYNFMYIETGNRQTAVEIFELPANKDCSIPTNFSSVICARANNLGFYPGASISATFTPSNANSTYYARFQRINVTDQALEGTFFITKSYPNEAPCTATSLQVQPKKGTKPTFGNNFTAADWKPEILNGQFCGSNNDVWYKFVATSCAMEVFVGNLSKTSYEMQAALLSAVEGDCSNQLEVLPCAGFPDQYLDITLSSDNLIIGKTYYVIIDGFSPPYLNSVGKFSIEVYEKAIQPDCSKITGVSDVVASQIKIFPNPADKSLTINIEQLADVSHIEITTIEGRIVRSIFTVKDENTYNFDVSDLNNGLYFIHGIREDGKKVVQRFVVQH